MSKIRVKPLEWRNSTRDGASLWSGELVFNTYYTLYNEGDGWRVFRQQFSSREDAYETAFVRDLEAAKAAAQADYEAGILSAIERSE